MRKKNVESENYLDRKPVRNEMYEWKTDENGVVTLEIENKGLFNKIAHAVFKKPKISYVHLDEMGSFIWPILDGKKSILELGEAVEEKFGEAANPLYERLAKYMQILDSYGFIKWN